MEIALVHDHYDEKHLEYVKEEMKNLGTPIIKAVWMECFGVLAAIEGCHRIRAAKELGLTPDICEVEYSDSLTDDDILISDICDSAHSSAIIEF